MFARCKVQVWLIAVVAVLAALISSFLDERVGYAQGEDNDYVDVGLILEYPDSTSVVARNVKVIVMNHGGKTAYDVEVVVEIVYPEDSSYWTSVPNVPAGSASLGENGYSFRWTIPALGGLQREEISVRSYSTGTNSGGTNFNKDLYPHEFFGEVTTSSFESDLHKRNNTDRIWYEVIDAGSKWSRQAKGKYFVENVSVDNPNPSPGEIVDFTLAARSPNFNIDWKVTIELTDGLAFGGTISYVIEPTGRTLPSDSSGVITVGTRHLSDSIDTLTATVPIRVASDAVVNEQCLTATITGNPPTGAGPFNDDISDNVAKLCLGAAPAGKQTPLDSGTADLFVWYDCVGKSAAPCQGSDLLELVALSQTGASEVGSVLQPSQVTVHVSDPEGRIEGRDSGGLVWSTGFPEITAPARAKTPGVALTFNSSLMDIVSDTEDPGEWGSDHEVGGVNYRIGNVQTGSFDVPAGGQIYAYSKSSYAKASNRGYFGGDTPMAEGRTYSPWWIGYSWAVTEIFFEFTKLGTYELPLTITAAYDSDGNGPNNPVSPQPSDTETYTFHVGPLQDLEVRAGGSSHVADSRTAYTILAANNGPENTVDATVKIALPSGVLVEDYVASEGTYANGQWNLPGLEMRDYRRSQGEVEEASLTLILKDGGIPQEPATATISLTDNSYNVCIGSDRRTLAHTTQATCVADTTAGGSWHEGVVYEYPNNNSTAKITARGGGAAGTSGGPMAPRFANTPVLTWESVPHVNDWPVYRYQVQYLSGNDWLDLADVPGTQTHFADTGAGSGRSYRVRALNEAGVPGFWSRSASQVTYRQASPPLNVTAAAGQAGEVVVSWEPSSDDGGSPITYYQAQWSRTGTSGWSNACRSDSASQHTCTNTGIPSGETRYYRVAAYAGGLGAWSDLAVATAVAGVPEAPSLSASRATTGSGDNILRAIRLTWSQPRDNGSTIYAYEIDYVDYDQVARKCGTDWQALDGIGYRYSDSPPAREYLDAGNFGDGLEPGAYRCYRVRAVNSAGAGAWSNAASASAGGAVPPDEWLYLDGEADGQNAITLYWGEPHFDGGAPVTGYQLQYSEDGENWRNLTSTSASARSYTHTGRKVGETWHYQIRARNSAGWGGWSYPVTVTIEEGKTANLSQPTLTAQARTSKEVLLSWSSLCNPNREGDCESKGVDGYMVEYSEDGGLYGWERLTWLWTDQTKVLDSTVEPGATRYYRVAGYKEENRRQLLGRWSQVKSATTADFSVGAPQNFRIEKEGERALRLEWDAVTEGRDAESITGYRIERSTWNGDGPGDFDTSWVVRQTNRGIGPYVETGLTPNTQYYYQVAAVTRNGAVPYIGPYSMVSIFIPPAGN